MTRDIEWRLLKFQENTMYNLIPINLKPKEKDTFKEHTNCKIGPRINREP